MSYFDRLIWGSAAVLVVLIAAVAGYENLRTAAFSSRPSLIVYLGQDDEGIFQIHTVDPQQQSLTPTRWTSGPHQVLDYSVASTGGQIAYSLEATDGSHDLYLLDLVQGRSSLLLDCVITSCTRPVWSPDDERLIFEQRNLPTEPSPPGPPRLWWLDLRSRQTAPVFSDSQQLGLGASFSPDGRWLALVVPLREELMAINLSSGESISLASSTGEPPVWGPGGTLYFTEVELKGELVAVHLYRAELESGEIVDLSGENSLYNDGSAGFNATLDRLVFTRKPARTAAGKQIWIMGADGRDPHSLTDNLDIHNGLPSWSPDGRMLVVQRFNLSEPFAEPEIWLIDVERRSERRLAAPGINPGWIP